MTCSTASLGDAANIFSDMIGVLGHDSALKGYTGPWKIWDNEKCFSGFCLYYDYHSENAD